MIDFIFFHPTPYNARRQTYELRRVLDPTFYADTFFSSLFWLFCFFLEMFSICVSLSICTICFFLRFGLIPILLPLILKVYLANYCSNPFEFFINKLQMTTLQSLKGKQYFSNRQSVRGKKFEIPRFWKSKVLNFKVQSTLIVHSDLSTNLVLLKLVLYSD